MKIQEILKEDLDASPLYKVAEQAFELLSKSRRSLGYPVTMPEEDELHQAILKYLKLI